jgi:hypothetical protein
LLILLIIVSVTYVSNGARTIYVDDDSPADFDNIQAAIDDANNGDTILIAEGIYTGSGNYNIDFKRKAITVRSTDPNDPNVVANTIINPSKVGRGFYLHSGEDANCIVSGLTIRDGYTSGSGGAVYCIASSPTIKNCVMIKNAAKWGGGGMYCFNSKSTIRNCVLAGNSSLSRGGGMNCNLCDNLSIINCTISGNSAQTGGEGIDCDKSSLLLTNCIIWGNGLQQICSRDSNTAVTFSNVQDGWEGTGNIDVDPCFASFDPNGDPNIWDFHLQSAYGRWDPNFRDWVTDSSTSLCIDAGDPNLNWSAEPWPNGKRINMGAYGGTRQASMNGSPSDFNIDGNVNFEDFCELAGKWGYEGSFIENLNNNGTVDFADLRIFAENWLWRQE